MKSAIFDFGYKFYSLFKSKKQKKTLPDFDAEVFHKDALKKICIVLQADFVGGAEFFVLDFLKSFFKNELLKEYEIALITSDNKDFLKEIPFGVELVLMDFPRLKIFSLKAIKDFLKTSKILKQNLEKIKPDFIWTNSIRAHVLAGGIAKDGFIKLLNQKVPLFFFVHDFTFPSVFLKIFKNKPKKILTCSKKVKQDLQDKGFKKEIKIIHNGVEINPNQKVRNIEKEVNISIIGRIDTWKGQDVFVDVAEVILKKIAKQKSSLKPFRNVKYNFWIIGESNKHDLKTVEFEDFIKTKIKSKNLENVIKMTGFLEKEKAFLNTDICLHLSTQNEPFGRVIIEAMSYKIPVIASLLQGENLIFDQKTGFLCDTKKPEIIADKVIELVENPTLYKEISENAFHFAKNNFDQNKITLKLIQELKS